MVLEATMASRSFQVVVAAAKQLGIGKAGSMPWKLPPDMAYFKELTSKTRDPAKQNAVIMGRCGGLFPPMMHIGQLDGRSNAVLQEDRGSTSQACFATARLSAIL